MARQHGLNALCWLLAVTVGILLWMAFIFKDPTPIQAFERTQDAPPGTVSQSSRGSNGTDAKSIARESSRPSHLSHAKRTSSPSFDDLSPSTKGSSPISCQTKNVEGHLRIFCEDSSGGIEGQWMEDQDRTFAAPICCDASFPNIHPDHCTQVHYPDPQAYQGMPLGQIHQQINGHACECGDFTDNYRWISPTFYPPNSYHWDASQACQLLGPTRRVLMIGDSTMQQTASTLMNSLLPGGCAPQISLRLSDFLVPNRRDRGESMEDYLQEWNPRAGDIVLVSASAHIHDDADFLDALDSVLGLLAEYNRQHPNVTFVWKTNQPAGCADELYFPQSPKEAAESYNYSSYHSYNHKTFYHRDLYVLHVLQQLAPQSPIQVLDMRMLYSRTDAHIANRVKGGRMDCLHFCSPGPLDIIGPLFFQLLQRIT